MSNNPAASPSEKPVIVNRTEMEQHMAGLRDMSAARERPLSDITLRALMAETSRAMSRWLASSATPDTERLDWIARIIENVDQRCMAVDGPVTKTLDEITQAEMSLIYAIATRTQGLP